MAFALSPFPDTRHSRTRPALSRNRPSVPITTRTTTMKRDGNLPGRPDAKKYRVEVRDPARGVVHRVDLPEDRYIWSAMTEAGIDVPFSCRNGCCTTCAVRVESGEVDQQEALGLLKEMRQRGYALLCVSYPRSDLVCTLQDEDEVYSEQFGTTFESGGVEWGGFLPEEEH